MGVGEHLLPWSWQHRLTAETPAGDVLAVSKLIYRIIAELKNSSDAAANYQDLVIDLEGLDRALQQVQSIEPGIYDLKQLNGIRALARSCHQPLETFLEKISKFENRMGAWQAKENRFRGFGRRIEWTVYEDDVKELREKLATKLITINILLSTQDT